MENFYSSDLKTRVQRVNVTTARKMYAAGFVVHMTPCRCRFDNNYFVGRISIERKDGETFDMYANAARHYGCTNETGRYLHYFVTCDDLKQFKAQK